MGLHIIADENTLDASECSGAVSLFQVIVILVMLARCGLYCGKQRKAGWDAIRL